MPDTSHTNIAHTRHVPVLLHEVLHHLNIVCDDIVVDGTLGGGGHAYAMASKLDKKGIFIGIDLDMDAITRTKYRLKDLSCRMHFVEDNYCNLEVILHDLKVERITKALLDLGLSSDQLEVSGRGFAFSRDEPLSMAFSTTNDLVTARDIVNEWGEETLTTIFQGYGEEPHAARIARAIVNIRNTNPIESTGDLVTLIEKAVPYKWRASKKIHPATRVFQALRVAVNDEYQSLVEGMEACVRRLVPGGRMAIITFESLTDRTVKQHFRRYEQQGMGVIITKKPIAPSDEEVKENPRARSAKLRIFEKK